MLRKTRRQAGERLQARRDRGAQGERRRAASGQVSAEVPVDMDALRVAREKAAEKRASIKLRETPEWLSGRKSGEAGVAARERLPGPFGGGKKKEKAPKKKEKSESVLRATAEDGVRGRAAGPPRRRGWRSRTRRGTRWS